MSDNKIFMVNWLLTRKCNLRCSYCSIIKKNEMYNDNPFHNQLSDKEVIKYIELIHKNDPHTFHMFLGGEPTLFPGLENIINYCNDNNILYAILTNITKYSFNKISEILNKVDYINSLTFTIDPVIFDDNYNKSDDRYIKSKEAYDNFIQFQNNPKIKEFVATVCVDNYNINFLEKIISDLSEKYIWADIVMLETKLNDYYDFSTSCKWDDLVLHNDKNIKILSDVYEKSKEGIYYILGNEILPLTINSLPHKWICDIGNKLDTITIDSDGSLRLCLRIRGTECSKFYIKDLYDSENNKDINNINEFKKSLLNDKQNYCLGCMWTCTMFSHLMSESIIDIDDVMHINK